MRSAKSWFNATLYKKNLARFWPLWALYLVIWLFMFPVGLLLENNGTPERFAERGVLQAIPEAGLVMALLFSAAVAAAVWSYLCNNRSTCLMHTLPIRREGLFLTNFLSGMTFFIGPNLLIFVLTWMAEGVMGYVDVGALVMWFFSVTLMELFFFCFATFCSMCTGHILGMPALYAVFNGLVAGVQMLVDQTLSRFVFGYDSMPGFERFAEWMTPVWKLNDNLRVRRITDVAVDANNWQFVGLGYILIYVFFGLVLAGLALLLYRHRHMEGAGDIITVPWMRPVFQYGVAFCCALAFGTILYELFRGALPQTAWTLLIFMLFCGAVGYFAARMLLEKSFRVFRFWKGCVPFLAVLVLLTCALEFDLIGFERRVPEQGEVAEVEVVSYDSRPYDAASHVAIHTDDSQVIHAVLAAHRSFVEHKDSVEQHRSWDGSHLGWSGFEVIYTLTDGSRIVRDYQHTIPMVEQDLTRPGTPTAALNELINLPLLVETAYGLTDESAEDLARITLNNWTMGEKESQNQFMQDAVVSPEAQERLLEAVMADFAEGNLGVRYVADTEARMENCFVNDLNIYFERIATDKMTHTIVEYPTATVTEPVPYPMDEGYYNERISVTLQITAKHTLAVLAEEGILDVPVQMITQAQAQACDIALQQSDYDWDSVDERDYVWAVFGE